MEFCNIFFNKSIINIIQVKKNANWPALPLLINKAIKVVKDFQASIVGEACLIDRSSGNANIGVKLISLINFDIPTYKSDNLPKDLEAIPAIKPGSRNL